MEIEKRNWIAETGWVSVSKGTFFRQINPSFPLAKLVPNLDCSFPSSMVFNIRCDFRRCEMDESHVSTQHRPVLVLPLFFNTRIITDIGSVALL